MANLKTSQNGERKPQVVVAIPCFNEERFIGSVVLKARKYADKVLVIDDGSADASAEVARDAGATVYRNETNKGYGAAVRTALQKGREKKADVLVILDADGQHDPKYVPVLVKPILAGQADVVVGSRFLGEAQKVPFYRRLGQRALTVLTNLGSGHKLSDSQSGFRAYSAEALKVLNLSETGMSVSSEIQFAISKSGLKVVEVPIAVSYMDKAKRNPLVHGMNVLSRVLVLISLRNPLVLFGIPGIMLLSGGLALGVRVLNIYGRTSQFAIGNALGAILLCMAGILALFAALMLQSMKELMRREWERFQKSEVTESESHEEGKGPDSS